MTDLLTRARTAGNGFVPPNPSGLPTRRRWGRVAAGVALFVFFVWGTTALVLSAGDRVEVLVVARDVDRFEEIDEGDLRVDRVGVDRGVDTVPAAGRDELVGRVASVDLVEGALLSPDQVVPEGERVVGEGEVLVGARLRPGELPPDGVRSGSDVLVVIRPPETASGDSVDLTEVEGWLLSVGETDEATGERSASLVVPRSGSPEVSAAAADGRLSVVVVEE